MSLSRRPLPMELSDRPSRSRGVPSRGRRRAVAATLVAGVLLVAAVGLGRALLSAAVDGSTGGRPGTADGYVDVAHPISPFADVPAITSLTPGLRTALQAAARAAEGDGVHLLVTSGWRDQRYQDWLSDQALARGGEKEASENVAAGSSSRHLTGDAVDIGPTDADSWMQQHGAGYGLCQIYANEMWHYELATRPGGTCPAQYADASARP